jgi:hypothetical protein
VFALAFRLLAAERRFLAGGVAGLLLFKPQLLLGLGVWWLLDVRRYWRCFIGLGVTAGGLAILSWAAVPAETAEWVRRFPAIARYDAFEFFNLHNPRGFGEMLTGNRATGNWFGLLGLGLAVTWLGLVWRRNRDDRAVMFAAAVFATLWGSPHTMTYEWALAVIPAVLVWDRRPDLRPTWLALFAVGWAVLFVSTPLTKAQLGLSHHAVQISVPVLAWIGLAAGRALRRGHA